jgi:hypothetical protein
MRTTPYRPARSLRDLYAAAFLAALADRTPPAGHPVPGKPAEDGTPPLRATT